MLHTQVIYLTGWAPHSSQQRAARRGSASASFQVCTYCRGAAPSAGIIPFCVDRGQKPFCRDCSLQSLSRVAMHAHESFLIDHHCSCTSYFIYRTLRGRSRS